MHAVHGRRGFRGNDPGRDCCGDGVGQDQRTFNTNHRSWREHHGRQEAGRLFLSSRVLRFTTAGNVDDGKSTLIGRLLVETEGAFVDQIEGARRENERRGGKGIDFSLLTDGLKAEREQGITIDVEYRQERYVEIRRGCVGCMTRLGGAESVCIPISALEGDFVTEPSTRMPWYTGPKLREILESVNVDEQLDDGAFRFPMPLVGRPPS